jgi:hypothetical protein
MKNCRKCGGTGFLKFTNVDGGRCWACGPQADTSYTRKYVGATDAELEAEMAEIKAETVARQAARRAVRDLEKKYLFAQGNLGIREQHHLAQELEAARCEAAR